MLETCKCGPLEGLSFEQLRRRIPRSCKMPEYLCTNLDRELNRARTERDRKEAYNERRRRAKHSALDLH